jgi:pimeloyl-ACP methyl ester carboxylesterase
LDASDDPLAGRLDVARVGVFGHSFGGGAAVVAAQQDERLLAAANLDGALWRAADACRLARPVLMLFAGHPEMTQPCAQSVEEKFFSSVEWCEQDRALHVAAWQELVDSGRPGRCVLIEGARHRSFMDWRLLRLRRWSLGAMDDASIDPRRMWETLTSTVRSFFDEHVRGEGARVALPSEAVTTTPREAFAPT